MKTPWMNAENLKEPLTQIGFFDFADLHFEVYEGKGGHLPGEVVLIDYKNQIAFTGDVYINVHGLTAEQAEYNQYAPILMTSVDTDPKLCGEERALNYAKASLFCGAFCHALKIHRYFIDKLKEK